jgi:hypothetical protein
MKRVPPFKTILILITLLTLTGCNLPGGGDISVSITSHTDGQTVVLMQETRIVSRVTASRGVEKVQLFINGQLTRTDSPPEGSPNEYVADQPWIPDQEGNVILTIVATDIRGNTSEPVSVAVQVVPAISGADATPTPTSTTEPEGETDPTVDTACINEATFVEDVSIPVNAYVSPGANFTKIWRVNNSGTCEWSGYQLILTSGDALGAASPQAVPLVSPGSNVDLSIPMTAPGTPGTYSAIWRLRAGDGTLFGPDLSLTIIVPQPATLTFTPTVTATPSPTFTLTPTPTKTPTATTEPLSVEQIYEQISINPSANGSTTVTCPAGSVVVSGGFASSTGLRVYHSMMDGNGWRVYARNNSGSSRLLNVYATCLSNSGGTVTQAFFQGEAVPNDTAHLEVACPAGSVVTGGGWVIGSTNPVEIYNSTRAGNGWQIYINNTGGSSPLINVYAICLSGVSGSTTQVYETGDVPGNDIGNVNRACPAGSYVTGGGFATNLGVVIYNTTKDGNGWQNYARNTLGSTKGLNTYAICYSP